MALNICEFQEKFIIGTFLTKLTQFGKSELPEKVYLAG